MKSSSVDWYSIYKKWTINSEQFEYLFKSTPFVTAKYMEEFEVALKSEFHVPEKLKNILETSIGKDRILIFDVDTKLGIALAVMLNNKFNVSPILSYNFLFHPYGVVGNKNLIEDLIAAADKFEETNPITHALILDKDRYTNDLNLNDPYIFNNQYEITEEEMPDVDTLKRLEKKEAYFMYISSIKEDIACYLEHLKANNFIVNTINIGEI